MPSGMKPLTFVGDVLRWMFEHDPEAYTHGQYTQVFAHIMAHVGFANRRF